MSVECRRIVFSGRVQGVGFRMTTVEFARKMAVAGTVRNREDGAVELIVEGDGQVIDELVRRLREHFGGFVRSVEQAGMGLQGFSGGVRVIS